MRGYLTVATGTQPLPTLWSGSNEHLSSLHLPFLLPLLLPRGQNQEDSKGQEYH